FYVTLISQFFPFHIFTIFYQFLTSEILKLNFTFSKFKVSYLSFQIFPILTKNFLRTINQLFPLNVRLFYSLIVRLFCRVPCLALPYLLPFLIINHYIFLFILCSICIDYTFFCILFLIYQSFNIYQSFISSI